MNTTRRALYFAALESRLNMISRTAIGSAFRQRVDTDDDVALDHREQVLACSRLGGTTGIDRRQHRHGGLHDRKRRAHFVGDQRNERLKMRALAGHMGRCLFSHLGSAPWVAWF